MSSFPPFNPDPGPAPNHLVTQILPTGSPELAKYLTKYPIGAKFAADSDWTVEEVRTNSDIPPHPDLGPVTMVTLVMAPPAT